MSKQEPRLLSKIIGDFFQGRAKTESLENSKFPSKRLSARKNTVFRSRVGQTDTRNWLSRVCRNLLMILAAKKFWPISAQYAIKLIVCCLPKSQKCHVDFGHSLRKMTVTSRPLLRSGSNSQDDLIRTSSTRFLTQLRKKCCDPPTLKASRFYQCFFPEK